MCAAIIMSTCTGVVWTIRQDTSCSAADAQRCCLSDLHTSDCSTETADSAGCEWFLTPRWTCLWESSFQETNISAIEEKIGCGQVEELIEQVTATPPPESSLLPILLPVSRQRESWL